MSWIDTVVVGIILVVGLIILYKALQEPLDLLFGLIKKGFIAARDAISGANNEEDKGVIIKYG